MSARISLLWRLGAVALLVGLGACSSPTDPTSTAKKLGDPPNPCLHSSQDRSGAQAQCATLQP